MLQRYLRAMVILAAVAMLAGTPATGQAAPSEQEARDLGVEAYIYGYPLVTMEMTRRVVTNVAAPEGAHAPMGQFANLREYPNASFRDVTAPNADTLYSSAFLDVRKEPYVLSLPDEAGRYYLMPMLSGWTDVFQVPGKRTTGTKAQTYAITGPGWKGTLPRRRQGTQVADRTWSGFSAAPTARARPRTTRPCTRFRTSTSSCRCRPTANPTRHRPARSIRRRHEDPGPRTGEPHVRRRSTSACWPP